MYSFLSLLSNVKNCILSGDKTKDIFSGEETTPLPEQTTVPDQTTLIPNEAEAFALEPIDVTSIGKILRTTFVSL